MKNNSTPHNTGAQNAGASTTEELIVQYLDGELVRKELETVLFDRLAHSDEARMLLREYLVVRGAIRVSRNDQRFQLSDDLDARTRARIQQIMEAMEQEELLVPAAGERSETRQPLPYPL
jgi:negative regulator of sigma E activity